LNLTLPICSRIVPSKSRKASWKLGSWLYRRHVISRGRAAEILRLNFEEFLRLSNATGIPYFDFDAEDIEYELRAARRP
jgi:hypothetical protein